MLRFVVPTALALTVPVSVAYAADLPAKAPGYTTLPIAAPSWNGFYVGLNAGGVWSTTDINWDADPGGFGVSTGLLNEGTSGRLKKASFTVGGQVGFNKQFDNLVFGVEADLQYTGVSGTRSGAVFIPPVPGIPGIFDSFTESVDSKWLGTLRGRLGVAFGSWLPYATGGMAIARVGYSDFGVFPFLPSTNFASASETLLGWTLGGGAEWKFAPRWSIKAEYLYVDLGTISYTSLNSVVGAVASINHTHHLTENIARIGLNYSFGQLAGN